MPLLILSLRGGRSPTWQSYLSVNLKLLHFVSQLHQGKIASATPRNDTFYLLAMIYYGLHLEALQITKVKIKNMVMFLKIICRLIVPEKW